MGSVRSIAKKAGVSITTVSRVLNNHPQVSSEIRQRVLAASNEARYVPSVGRRSKVNIALIYTGENSIGSPFDAALLSGVSRAMEDFGFDLMILDARRARLPSETFTQMFLRKGICGAILRTTAEARPVCELISEEGFPAVVVAERFDNPKVSYVYCDSRDSSREAVEHLIAIGHRRIALCLNIVSDSDHEDRLGGYRQALAQHGIEFDRRLVLRAPAQSEGGAQFLRRLVTMPDRPTAVFLTDPLTCVGAMNEARKLGVRVPQDLSIVGFDDAELRIGMTPTLTAVCQDAAVLGREAFTAVRSMIAGADSAASSVAPVRKALRTWFEIHDSTCAITPVESEATSPRPSP